MTAVMHLRGLELALGRFRLGPIDLEISQGEYIVVVGPSGAGKSVLLETMIGWHAPSAGSVVLDGIDVRSIPAGERGFAYVPQDIGLLPHLTVRKNLLFALDCRGARPDSELLANLTAVLNLDPLLERQDPLTLSQGERQRVALGRALLTRPRKLFLDEPCASLDPHLRREFQLLLRDLHRRMGQTVVHVTHDREEAFLLGERIAVMLEGRLRQLDPPEGLYQRPANVDVACFLAPENLWRASALACEEDGGGEVALERTGCRLRLRVKPVAGAGGSCLVGIRPEEVMILHPDRPLRPHVQDNVFAGKITEILRLDGRVQIHFESREGLRAVSRLPICAAEDLDLAPGMEIRVSLKTRSLYTLAP